MKKFKGKELVLETKCFQLIFCAVRFSYEESAKLSSVYSANLFSSGTVATADSLFCSVAVVPTGTGFCSIVFVSVGSVVSSASS